MPKPALDLKSLARSHTEGAVQTLAGVMYCETMPASARVSAATALLERGWGKAPTTFAGENGEGEITIVIRRLVDEDEAKLKTIEGRTVKVIDTAVRDVP